MEKPGLIPEEPDFDIGAKVVFRVSDTVLEVSSTESVSENLVENEFDRFVKAAFTAEGDIPLFLFLRYQ